MSCKAYVTNVHFQWVHATRSQIIPDIDYISSNTPTKFAGGKELKFNC
ncbi:hypothetical protein RINTHM_11910 [Richelia intracellularis HM01]|nr:hypothetical protein RINTHM_11910 [Richelia intracellularis HM01]